VNQAVSIDFVFFGRFNLAARVHRECELISMYFDVFHEITSVEGT
jgi:hypothetical protein